MTALRKYIQCKVPVAISYQKLYLYNRKRLQKQCCNGLTWLCDWEVQ
jgi:hypothetical protein